MRPFFAIVPLALALSFWGPASHANSNSSSSWTTAVIDWVLSRHTVTSLPAKAASSPTFEEPFQSH